MRKNLTSRHNVSCGISHLLRIYVVNRLFKFCLITASILTTGCATLNPTMPVKIPIDLGKAGSVAEAEFWIPLDDRVVFSLNFFVNPYLNDSKRLSEFAGGFNRKGVIVPLKVTLVEQKKLSQDIEIFEKMYLTDGLKGVGVGKRSIDRKIDRINIKSGSYKLTLETIQSFPNLSETMVQFEVYYSRPHK